jgi:predicted membrane GTPase involved in stress response
MQSETFDEHAQPAEGKGIQLEAPLKMSLERAIEYIEADDFR